MKNVFCMIGRHKMVSTDGKGLKDIAAEYKCERKNCHETWPAIVWPRLSETPETIHEAVLEILTAEDCANLKCGDPVQFHHNTGRWMRNNWGLWDTESKLNQEFNSIGIFHADDMSGIILETAHRILNGKSVDLAGQVMGYKEYWGKSSTGLKGYNRG